MSAVAGIFNAFPNTSFSQNVGLISFTGVASRSVVGIAGVFLIVLGLVPKVAAVVSAMPNPVLGGAGVVLFGMIISIGLRMIAQGATLTQRNLTIIAVSLVIGVGVEWRSDALAQLPSEAQVLATSGLIMGGVTALVLNAVLPENGDSGTPSVMGDPIAEDDD
jgi:xanthine/uracil permease